jgi:hypothetical protein
MGYNTTMPNAPTPPGSRRAAYILTIWTDAGAAATARWRGCLESGDGQRHDFRTLAELNHLLARVGGWTETATNEPNRLTT